MPFGLKNAPTTYQRVVNTTIKDYFGMFMKLFLDDSNVFIDLDTHLTKLRLCFDKCREFGISLNLKKMHVLHAFKRHHGLCGIQGKQAIRFEKKFGYCPHAYPKNT
jgi:hypothetical protein